MSLFLQVYLTHHDPIVITELPLPYHMNSCHLLMGGPKPHSEAEMCKGLVIFSLRSDYLYFKVSNCVHLKRKGFKVSGGVISMSLRKKLAEL